MSDYRVAIRYAKALFQLADEQGVTNAVQSDLTALRALIDATPELRGFLANAAMTHTEQRTIVDALFLGRATKLVHQAIAFLIARRRLPLLADVCAAFQDLFLEARQILPARVMSAFPMPAGQIDALRQKLATKYQKQIELTAGTDATLIGGFIVRVKDHVHDCSIKGQLDMLRATLVRA